MSPENMVTMVNQIAMFFDTQPGMDPCDGVVDHLRDFWEPRMREQLRNYVADGGGGLIPTAIKAARRI